MFFKYLKLSLSISLIFLCFIVQSQNSVPAKIRKSNLYTGIEIGSKGVKMSIIQMKKNASTTGAFNSIKDSSINCDFISFTPESYIATLKGLTELYNIASNDYNVPPSKIFTVFSSGVKGQALKDKKLDLLNKLRDTFRLLINDPTRLLPAVDAMEEAKLSHLGIIPEDRRYNTFLIDIGSGNTKGGYFKNGNSKELKLFTLTWGTKSTTNAVEKRLNDDKSIENFKKNLSRLMAGEPDNEIVYAVNESGAYNMNDFFAFSGGIAWSVATLLNPELIDNAVIPVSFNDVVWFNEKLATKFDSFQPKNLAKVFTDDAIEKEMVITEATRVHKWTSRLDFSIRKPTVRQLIFFL
jgi:hypothetical protein